MSHCTDQVALAADHYMKLVRQGVSSLDARAHTRQRFGVTDTALLTEVKRRIGRDVLSALPAALAAVKAGPEATADYLSRDAEDRACRAGLAA